MSTAQVIEAWENGVEPYTLLVCPNCKKYHDLCEGTAECIKAHKETMKKRRILNAYKQLYITLLTNE